MANFSPAYFPVFRAFDANGNPLAGGKLYSYAAGTTTPLATYTDATGGTPNTNPVTLDANGEAQVWLGSDSYKFVLQDATGAVLWTVDGIKSMDELAQAYADTLRADLANTADPAKGAALVGWKRPETGAVATTLDAWIDGQIANIKADFGAVGDGVTDDTAAIAAALASGVKKIHFPAGTYLYTPPLIIDVDGMAFVGEDRYTTILKPAPVAQPALIIGSSKDTFGVHFQDIKLEGNPTCTDGIVLGTIVPQKACVSYSAERVYIYGFSGTGAAAIKPSISWWHNISDCTLTGNYYGVHCPENCSVTTLVIDKNTAITQSTKNAFYAPGPGFLDVVTFRSCSIEYSGQQAIRSSTPSTIYILDNVYFEQNNASLPACGQIEVSGTADTAYTYAQVFMSGCKSDVPQNSGWNIDIDYTRTFVSNSVGWQGTATPIRDTENSVVELSNLTGRSSVDMLAVARGLSGLVRCYDINPYTGDWRTYDSDGSVFEQHIGAKQPTPPIVAAGPQAGTGGTYVLAAGSSDTHGQVNFTPGTGTGAGPYVRVTFNKAYTEAPIVVLTYASSDGASAPSLYVTSTTGYFDIGFNNTPVAGLKYIGYHVMGN